LKRWINHENKNIGINKNKQTNKQTGGTYIKTSSGLKKKSSWWNMSNMFKLYHFDHRRHELMAAVDHGDLPLPPISYDFPSGHLTYRWHMMVYIYIYICIAVENHHFYR